MDLAYNILFQYVIVNLRAKLHAKLSVPELLRMDTIAERLLRVRGKTKQGEFAKSLGINPNTLRTYENGRSLPNQEVLERICVQFSVSPAWLLLGVGPMRANLEEPLPSPENAAIGIQGADGAVTKLERELELERGERRDLAAEIRRLYREKEQLLREKEQLVREIGTLREKLARLEAGKQSAAQDDDGNFPGLFTEQPPRSSSAAQRVHK